MDIELERLAEIRMGKVTVGQYVVNGVPMGGREVDVPFLCCPECGTAFQRFDGMTPAEVNEVLLRKDVQDRLSSWMGYCPNCGCRISFRRECIDVDAE